MNDKKLIKEEVGINKDTGNQEYVYKERGEGMVQISPTKYRLPTGKIVSIDPNEQCYEWLNLNKFDVWFQNCHPDYLNNFKPELIKVPPQTHAFIPHRYFKSWAEFVGNKAQIAIQGLEIYGKEMFKGVTKPSRPTK